MANPLQSVAFVVVSCDKYSDLWEPFFCSFRKYWSDCPFNIYLITNRMAYHSPGITVIQIGEDKSYADNIRKALSSIREEWVILWLEDVMFFRTIDTHRVTAIIESAQSIPVGYLKLGPDLPLSYEDAGGSEIGPLPKGIRYRSAVGTALYHVETLKKLLVEGASAWELDTSDISNELPEPFYALTADAVSRPPIEWVNTVNKGRWAWAGVRFLKKHGFEHLLPNRPRQTLRETLYLRSFLLYAFMLRKLRIYWR